MQLKCYAYKFINIISSSAGICITVKEGYIPLGE